MDDSPFFITLKFVPANETIVDGISDSFRSKQDRTGMNNKKTKYLFNKDRLFGLDELS